MGGFADDPIEIRRRRLEEQAESRRKTRAGQSTQHDCSGEPQHVAAVPPSHEVSNGSPHQVQCQRGDQEHLPSPPQPSVATSRIIHVTCDHCSIQADVPEHFSGRMLKCKACGRTSLASAGERVVPELRREMVQAKSRQHAGREKMIAVVLIGSIGVLLSFGLLIAKFGAESVVRGLLPTLAVATGVAVLVYLAIGAKRAIAEQRETTATRKSLEIDWSDMPAIVSSAVGITVLFCCMPFFGRDGASSNTSSRIRWVATQGTLLAPSEEALDRLVTAAQGEPRLFATILLSDAYHPLHEGTEVIIQESGFTRLKVMVASGPKIGIVGWVLRDSIRSE